MNTVELLRVFSAFREANIPLPISITINAKSFRELKADSRPMIEYVTFSKLPLNQLKINGVTIIGKLCECGAHLEDWE